MSSLSFLKSKKSKEQKPKVKLSEELKKEERQQEKYNQEARYQVLGQSLLSNTLSLFPDCLLGVRAYTFQSPVKDAYRLKILEPLRYFEDALDETMLLLEEELEEKEELKEKIKQYARKIAGGVYQKAISEIAGYILQGCPRKDISLEKALYDYEKIKYLYAINISEHLLPQLKVQDTQGNQRKQPLENALYFAAMQQTQAKLEVLFHLPSKIFGTDGILIVTEKMLDALENYGLQECFSSQEQKNFQQKFTEQYHERYVQKFYAVEKSVCQRQDDLYEQWKTSISQGFLQNGETALKLLMAFTDNYRFLLEETGDEVALRCRKKMVIKKQTQTIIPSQ